MAAPLNTGDTAHDEYDPNDLPDVGKPAKPTPVKPSPRPVPQDGPPGVHDMPAES